MHSTQNAASGNQPAGFGLSAIHRKPRRRSYGRRQTLPSGYGKDPESRGQRICRETRQEDAQGEASQDGRLSRSISSSGGVLVCTPPFFTGLKDLGRTLFFARAFTTVNSVPPGSHSR
jgi:hypothetical protein